MGLPKLGVPPFCSWKELNDGTYTLADVEIFHQAMFDIIEASNSQ
jgi:hypothetical protein